MLGYELYDQEEMVVALDKVLSNIDSDPVLYEGVWKARDLIQGLWAEGYFD